MLPVRAMDLGPCLLLHLKSTSLDKQLIRSFLRRNRFPLPPPVRLLWRPERRLWHRLRLYRTCSLNFQPATTSRRTSIKQWLPRNRTRIDKLLQPRAPRPGVWRRPILPQLVGKLRTWTLRTDRAKCLWCSSKSRPGRKWLGLSAWLTHHQSFRYREHKRCWVPAREYYLSCGVKLRTRTSTSRSSLFVHADSAITQDSFRLCVCILSNNKYSGIQSQTTANSLNSTSATLISSYLEPHMNKNNKKNATTWPAGGTWSNGLVLAHCLKAIAWGYDIMMSLLWLLMDCLVYFLPQHAGLRLLRWFTH